VDAVDLRRRAAAWAAVDPDPVTREQLAAVVVTAERTGDDAPLAELVAGRLRFGTAGLRAPLGPGPRRLNRLVAEQTAAGIARVLLDEVDDARGRGVVVGHDARHGSAEFAAAAAEVLVAHGLDVRAFDGPVPTPLVATTARFDGAAAAIVVTASHNPAADNGIKVYWADGAQITAPLDSSIATAIDAVAAAMEAAVDEDPVAGPSAARRLLRPDGVAGSITGLGSAVAGPAVDAYVARAVGSARSGTSRPAVPIALTSLHGVGGPVLERVLRAGGHTDLHVVEAQRRPDPDFPTVAFPNPEEPGALDLLVDEARRHGCAVGLANDPDADRVAVVVPTGDDAWRALTGDEVGALLCRHLLSLDPPADDRPPLVVTTVVSSRLAAAIATAAGARTEETLTGFKWLCRPALLHPEWRQVLAYEEALGYAVGPDARDKDGITAGLVVADLVRDLAADGRTLLDELDDIARRHGAHVTRNGWTAVPADVGAALVLRLEATPPGSLGGSPVVELDRPAPDVLRVWTEDGTRVALRPSGTEPKLKYYCEAIEPVVDGAVATARATASERLDAVLDDVLRSLR
jgi:phosphomannomutase